jgi:hypothetical protein
MSERWGPWLLPVGHPERAPQFRSLAALCSIYGRHDLVFALRGAETEEAAAEAASRLLADVPALWRRKIVSTFGAVTYQKAKSQPTNSRPVSRQASSTP